MSINVSQNVVRGEIFEVFGLKVFEVIGSFGGDQNGVYKYEQDDHRWDYQRVSSQVNRRLSLAEFRYVLHPDQDPHGDGVDDDPDSCHSQQVSHVRGPGPVWSLLSNRNHHASGHNEGNIQSPGGRNVLSYTLVEDREERNDEETEHEDPSKERSE